MSESPITANELARDDELISECELAARTRTKVTFWANMRRRGDGPPFVRLGRRLIRYPWRATCAWMGRA